MLALEFELEPAEELAFEPVEPDDAKGAELPLDPDGADDSASPEGADEVCSVEDFEPNFSVNCGINFLTPKKTPPTMSNVIRKRENGVKRLIFEIMNDE